MCVALQLRKIPGGSCADWNVSGAAFMGGGLGAVLSHFDLMLKGTDVAGDGNYFFMMIIACSTISLLVFGQLSSLSSTTLLYLAISTCLRYHCWKCHQKNQYNAA